MKKRLPAIICGIMVLFLLTATACNDDAAKDVAAKSSYTTAGKTTKLVPDETATGELRVARYDESASVGGDVVIGDLITMATAKFKQLYPNVELIIENNLDGLGFSDYANKMSAQIMAGSGPDVFFVGETDMDVNKMMKTGVLADMYDYFENDTSFNIDDYNKTVFSGGQPVGSQYIIPISYSIPVYMTTEKMIEKSGLEITKLTDYLTFMQEMDKIAQKDEMAGVLPLWNIDSVPIYFPTYSGAERFNYDTGELKLDAPAIKDIYGLLKTHREKYTETNSTSQFSPANVVAMWRKEQNLFADFTAYPYIAAAETFMAASKAGEKPILFTLRNINGGITATSSEAVSVRGNSENKQNAYNFIKVLIDPEIRASAIISSSDVPVSNPAVGMVVERYIDQQQQLLGSNYDTYKAAGEAFVEQYTALLADVSEMDWYFNADLLLKEEMRPYLKGEASYETCIARAKDKLAIYLTE